MLLKDLLPGAAVGLNPKPLADRSGYDRLKLLAGLLREAPEGVPGQGRLLWRDRVGAVMAFAIERPLLLGRGHECDLTFSNPRISRRHFKVFPDVGGVVIEDIEGSSGTFVNGVCVRRRVLHDGDVVELGGQVFVYSH